LGEITSPVIVSNTFISCAALILFMVAGLNLHPKSRNVSYQKKIAIPAVVILALFVADIFLQKFYPGEYYLLALVVILTISWDGYKWVVEQFKKKESAA